MSSSKMTFEEFTETVKENIKDYLPDSYRFHRSVRRSE